MKLLLCLLLFATQAIAKPTPAIDFSELDKLVPAELKQKNTPGAVITVVSGDQVIYQKLRKPGMCRLKTASCL